MSRPPCSTAGGSHADVAEPGRRAGPRNRWASGPCGFESLRPHLGKGARRAVKAAPARNGHHNCKGGTMKLGEALALRSDLQTRIERLRGRLTAAALVQEGEKPTEDPQALLAELMRLADQLEELIVRVNRTNLSTTLPDGRTLTDGLARRDILALRQTALRQVADAAADRQRRYGLSEIRILATVDVGALRAQADDLARERRELDAAIQETNWQTELVE